MQGAGSQFDRFGRSPAIPRDDIAGDRTQLPPQVFRKPMDVSDALCLGLLAVVIVWLCAARWVKIESLVTGDPAMWLLQMARAAQGEWPYRDFSWNYPPLAVALFASSMRLFGATFATAQATIAVLGVIVAVLIYWWCRLLFPSRLLQFSVIVLALLVCVTSLTKYNLFSFETYSPSLQVSSIGLLAVIIGGVRHLRLGRDTRGNAVLLALGAFIAALSKPEAGVAALVGLTVLAALDPRFWSGDRSTRKALYWYGSIVGIVIAVVLLAYAWLAHRVGLDNMMAGLTGYGLASQACPWWPTGLGMFGAAASTGQAVAICLITAAPLHGQWLRSWRWWLAVGVAAMTYAAYVGYLNQSIVSLNIPFAHKIERMLPSILWTSPVLLPAMWAAVWMSFFLGGKCAFVGPSSLMSRDRELLFILSIPVVTALRGLFGTTLFPYTEVSAVCYPLFLVLGPYLLWSFLTRVSAGQHVYGWRKSLPAATVATLALGYGAARLIGGQPALTDGRYEELQTAAGRVRVADRVSARIYEYVVSHTSAGDSILDVPYGGGINFAARRRAPTFTTQFQQLRMPREFLDRDLALVKQHPPKLVIARNESRFGTTYGYRGLVGCPFPRLLWQPDTAPWDPAVTLPVIAHIENNYRPVARFGNRLILIPRDTSGVTASRSRLPERETP